jgi:cysteinyl-tRNA synthetase
MQQSTNSLLKVTLQINQAFIQMFLNNHQWTWIEGSLHTEFINALQNDLDFPTALTIIYEQSKSLPGLTKPKTYDSLIQILAIVIKELEILGIKYINPLEDNVLKSIIEEWKKAISEKNYPLSDSYRAQLINLKVI